MKKVPVSFSLAPHSADVRVAVTVEDGALVLRLTHPDIKQADVPHIADVALADFADDQAFLVSLVLKAERIIPEAP